MTTPRRKVPVANDAEKDRARAIFEALKAGKQALTNGRLVQPPEPGYKCVEPAMYQQKFLYVWLPLLEFNVSVPCWSSNCVGVISQDRGTEELKFRAVLNFNDYGFLVYRQYSCTHCGGKKAGHTKEFLAGLPASISMQFSVYVLTKGACTRDFKVYLTEQSKTSSRTVELVAGAYYKRFLELQTRFYHAVRENANAPADRAPAIVTGPLPDLLARNRATTEQAGLLDPGELEGEAEDLNKRAQHSLAFSGKKPWLKGLGAGKVELFGDVMITKLEAVNEAEGAAKYPQLWRHRKTGIDTMGKLADIDVDELLPDELLLFGKEPKPGARMDGKHTTRRTGALRKYVSLARHYIGFTSSTLKNLAEVAEEVAAREARIAENRRRRAQASARMASAGATRATATSGAPSAGTATSGAPSTGTTGARAALPNPFGAYDGAGFRGWNVQDGLLDGLVRAALTDDRKHAEQQMLHLPAQVLKLDCSWKTHRQISVTDTDKGTSAPFRSLLLVQNELGQIIWWYPASNRELHGEIKFVLEDLQKVQKLVDKERRHPVKVVYTDNCCRDRNMLKGVFGEECQVKLDVFHWMARLDECLNSTCARSSQIKKDLETAIFQTEGELASTSADRSRLIGAPRRRRVPGPGTLRRNVERVFRRHEDLDVVAATELSASRVRFQHGVATAVDLDIIEVGEAAILFKVRTGDDKWPAKKLALFKHIDGGCLSDPAGVSLYYKAIDGSFLTSRGTSSVERFFREVNRTIPPGCPVGPEKASYRIMMQVDRWNKTRRLRVDAQAPPKYACTASQLAANSAFTSAAQALGCSEGITAGMPHPRVTVSAFWPTLNCVSHHPQHSLTRSSQSSPKQAGYVDVAGLALGFRRSYFAQPAGLDGSVVPELSSDKDNHLDNRDIVRIVGAITKSKESRWSRFRIKLPADGYSAERALLVALELGVSSADALRRSLSVRKQDWPERLELQAAETPRVLRLFRFVRSALGTWLSEFLADHPTADVSVLLRAWLYAIFDGHPSGTWHLSRDVTSPWASSTDKADELTAARYIQAYLGSYGDPSNSDPWEHLATVYHLKLFVAMLFLKDAASQGEPNAGEPNADEPSASPPTRWQLRVSVHLFKRGERPKRSPLLSDSEWNTLNRAPGTPLTATGVSVSVRQEGPHFDAYGKDPGASVNEVLRCRARAVEETSGPGTKMTGKQFLIENGRDYPTPFSFSQHRKMERIAFYMMRDALGNRLDTKKLGCWDVLSAVFNRIVVETVMAMEKVVVELDGVEQELTYKSSAHVKDFVARLAKPKVTRRSYEVNSRTRATASPAITFQPIEDRVYADGFVQPSGAWGAGGFSGPLLGNPVPNPADRPAQREPQDPHLALAPHVYVQRPQVLDGAGAAPAGAAPARGAEQTAQRVSDMVQLTLDDIKNGQLACLRCHRLKKAAGHVATSWRNCELEPLTEDEFQALLKDAQHPYPANVFKAPPKRRRTKNSGTAWLDLYSESRSVLPLEDLIPGLIGEHHDETYARALLDISLPGADKPGWLVDDSIDKFTRAVMSEGTGKVILLTAFCASNIIPAEEEGLGQARSVLNTISRGYSSVEALLARRPASDARESALCTEIDAELARSCKPFSEYHTLVFPTLIDGNHWVTIEANLKTAKLTLRDSFHPAGPGAAAAPNPLLFPRLTSLIAREVIARSDRRAAVWQAAVESRWGLSPAAPILRNVGTYELGACGRQTDGKACGVFACVNMWLTACGSTQYTKMTQGMVEAVRRRIAEVIIKANEKGLTRPAGRARKRRRPLAPADEDKKQDATLVSDSD